MLRKLLVLEKQQLLHKNLLLKQLLIHTLVEKSEWVEHFTKKSLKMEILLNLESVVDIDM